jgi:hypothetical protein
MLLAPAQPVWMAIVVSAGVLVVAAVELLLSARSTTARRGSSATNEQYVRFPEGLP